jgi:peptidyl-dipeptidase A
VDSKVSLASLVGALALATAPALWAGGDDLAATAPQPVNAAANVAASNQAPAATSSAPTAEEARRFVEEAEAQLMQLAIEAAHAGWVQSTYITVDSQVMAAKANERLIGASMELAEQAQRFAGVDLPEDVARRILLLKVGLPLPAPSDQKKRAELTRIASEMEGIYGAGEYCPEAGKSVLTADDEGEEKNNCFDLEELSNVLVDSRDPAKLEEAWVGWHSIAPQMRDEYTRYVELANEGARELGFADLGAMWRAKYDMPPDAFATEVDRLWGQVKPFYDSLHCYVRAKLNEKYGDTVQPLDAPIRADLLGNMWAQEWANVYDVMAIPGRQGAAVDLSQILEDRNTTPQDMVRMGERFFTSLGFAPLPETFWERSMFTKPRDRDVVCHASAWSIDYKDDLRIKMCIEPTAEDFVTIHHELGHNFYQRAYNEKSFFYQDSAMDAFHEAIGDTVALSVTPEYLQEIGLVAEAPPAGDDIPLLLKDALDKIAFLPFGMILDQWRWKVFSGEVTPADYNSAWWELRERYQGVRPPVARTEADFDPGAKYHIPANVSYTRYFLARILQFQFHRSLCEIAGETGPLHRCSIYGSAEAGKRLQEMLALGVSQPWPDALEALTGDREIDATAIQDYFAPLKTWLDEQNSGRQCGW